MQRADHLSSGVLSLKRGRDDDSEVCSNRTAKRFRRVFEWSWLHHLHTLKNKISSIVKAGFTLPRDAFNGPLTKPQLSFFPNLASEQMGAKVVFVTDERWGAARNLLSSCSPQSATREGVPVVDGWQTQRRRKPGHEWAVIELAAPGRVCAITVDTRNYDETQITPNISIEAAFLGAEGDLPTSGFSQKEAAIESLLEQQSADDPNKWSDLVRLTPLTADVVKVIPIKESKHPVTHIRVNLFPDGGFARLIVHGEIQSDVLSDPHVVNGVVNLADGQKGSVVLGSTPNQKEAMFLLLSSPSNPRWCRWSTPRKKARPPILLPDIHGCVANFKGHEFIIIRLAKRGGKHLFSHHNFLAGTLSALQVEFSGLNHLANIPGRWKLEYIDDTPLFRRQIDCQLRIFSDPESAKQLQWKTAAGFRLTSGKEWSGVYECDPLVDRKVSGVFTVGAVRASFDPVIATHLRLKVVPDGCVACLKAFGVPLHEWVFAV
eukprot:GHVN01029275.1.p1 GENE.GHVN01029275.1~~GHVN01029275.1.p1  ORF type:complete len:573 (+),score=37.98 GHVN01029275.1:253-1719(+)